MFYGTNRDRSSGCQAQNLVTWNERGPCRPNVFYTGELALKDPDDGLEVGKFTITFPPSHQPGVVERPYSILSITFREEDPTRDVVISDMASSGNDYDAWVKDIKRTGMRQAFVFVHGYNTRFETAARLAGQLAFDLEIDRDFKGVPILYSWPSAGSYDGYFADYDAAFNSADAFNHFIDLVKRAGFEKVHIIAHSMGNWLVANALLERRLRSGAGSFVDQLVLAAPDIPAYGFRGKFLRMLPEMASRVTLYVSDKDKALEASAKFRAGLPRAGDRSGGLMAITEQRFDVVDATALPADFLDHSYYATNRSMRSDIYCLLQGSPAGTRPLLVAEGSNWTFRSRTALETARANACAIAAEDHHVIATSPVVTLPSSDSRRWWWLAASTIVLLAIAVLLVRRRRSATI